MKKLIIILFFLFNYSSTFALPVVINGKSSVGNAFVFRLYTQNDPIGGKDLLVDQQRPDANGNFMLGFDARNIQKVTIMVGLQSMTFFVEPGKTYQLNFNDITIKDQNLFLPQNPLHVQFESDDLFNLVIDGFDGMYDQFLGTKFIELVRFRDRRIYENFEKNVLSKLAETPLKDSSEINFFHDYIDYRLADLRLSSRIDEKEVLGLKMIDQRPVRMNNPAYSQFFMKYFDKYFEEYKGGKNLIEFRKSLELQGNYHQILDMMGEDAVLAREQIRELVMIYAFKQVYFQKQIDRKNINQMLQTLAVKSKFELNRSIAKSTFESLIFFQKGYPVPDFKLKNQKNEIRQLANYKGRKTFLLFVSPNCETCEADIRILNATKKDWENTLNVVTITAGFDQTENNAWVKKQNATWDFLWFNSNFELLNEYRVKNFPKYILLDEEGKLLYYSPPGPREDLLGFLKMIEQKEKQAEPESSDFLRKN